MLITFSSLFLLYAGMETGIVGENDIVETLAGRFPVDPFGHLLGIEELRREGVFSGSSAGADFEGMVVDRDRNGLLLGIDDNLDHVELPCLDQLVAGEFVG